MTDKDIRQDKIDECKNKIKEALRELLAIRNDQLFFDKAWEIADTIEEFKLYYSVKYDALQEIKSLIVDTNGQDYQRWPNDFIYGLFDISRYKWHVKRSLKKMKLDAYAGIMSVKEEK